MKILVSYQTNEIVELVIDQPLDDYETIDVSDEKQRNLVLSPQGLELFLHFLLKSVFFQSQFLQYNRYEKLEIELSHPVINEIDYKSCHMAFFKVWSQVELEDALHWMSTLGGAYSNLGDHSIDFAVKAGKNAYKQMAIALRSPDPLIIYKCWLFVAMSLMQQKQLKKSRIIIQTVHQNVKSIHQDKTLICMCKGIWARLKHTWKYSRL